MLKFQSLKSFLSEILEKALSVSAINDLKKKRKDSDNFFEEINRDIDNEINTSTVLKTDKGKALDESNNGSLEFFENTTTMDQTSEKQKMEQVFFNGSQGEIMRKMKEKGKGMEIELLTPQPETQVFGKQKPQVPLKHSCSLMQEFKKG